MIVPKNRSRASGTPWGLVFSHFCVFMVRPLKIKNAAFWMVSDPPFSWGWGRAATVKTNDKNEHETVKNKNETLDRPKTTLAKNDPVRTPDPGRKSGWFLKNPAEGKKKKEEKEKAEYRATRRPRSSRSVHSVAN